MLADPHARTGEIEVSIIIPSCGRERELRTLLERLLPQLPVDGSVEWQVWDDSADAAARRVLSALGQATAWHAGPRRGPAANRNAGARAARGRWLLFLDDDCEPRAGFLAAYLAAMATAPERTALEGATHAAVAPLPSLLWEAPHNPLGGALISCNFAIPRALFMEAGAFDERYPSAWFEDTEFAARLALLGVGVRFVPDAAVDHPLRRAPSAVRRSRRWEARVISSYDFGASTATILLRLPRHIAAVSASRFRGVRWSAENLRAALSHVAEVGLAVARIPGWVCKYRKAPRSVFWQARVAEGGAPPRYGL